MIDHRSRFRENDDLPLCEVKKYIPTLPFFANTSPM